MKRVLKSLTFSIVMACGTNASQLNPSGPTGPSSGTTGSTTGNTTGAPCQDVDGDGYGSDCPAGPDCNPDSRDHWQDCSLCVDNDGDVRGAACDRGDDCDDGNGRAWEQCDTCQDSDGDGHWTGCDVEAANTDCDDADAGKFQNLPGFTDGDGDGYTVESEAQTVCAASALPSGYVATSSGLDCDDSNPTYTTTCPAKMLGDLYTGGTTGAAETNPGAFVSVVALPAFQSTVLFRGKDERNGIELFRISGSGISFNVSVVRDLVPGPGDANVVAATDFGSRALLIIDDGVHGRELYVSDGTASGTHLVQNLTSGSGSSSLTLLGGNSPAYLLQDGDKLRTTDGVTISSTIDTAPSGVNLNGRAYTSGGMYFASDEKISMGASLYRSYQGSALTLVDFTGQANKGTVKQVLKASATSLYAMVQSYNTQNAAVGYSIWQVGSGSNGGTATRLSSDSFTPYTPGNGSAQLIGGKLGSTFYFTNCPGVEGCELYKASGGNFTMVKDINPNSASSTPTYYQSCNGLLYFVATDGSHGRELWKTNGTSAGTTMVKDIQPGSGGSDPFAPVCSGGKLFFVADDGSGRKLWMTDDSTGITRLAKNLALGNDFTAQNLFPYAGGVLFAPNLPGDGRDLWFSTGASIDTFRVHEGRVSTSSLPSPFFAHAGQAVFAANEKRPGNDTGRELWATDGTAAGTRRLADIASGSADSSPKYFTSLPSLLMFTATGGEGNELWATDLSPTGTHLVKDIHPSGSATPSNLTAIGSKLFFAATDPTHGMEPWVSDGSEGGTSLIADLNPGIADSEADNFAAFGPSVFFSASSPPAAIGNETWSTPLATPTTTPSLFADLDTLGNAFPKHFTVVDNRLYFEAADQTSGTELRRVNDAGTGVLLVKEIGPGTTSANVTRQFVHDNKLFFAATDADGQLPWVVNSTGTDAIKLKNASETPTVPREFVSVGTTLFFLATSAASGEELWKTDGTAAGTVRLSQIGSTTTDAGITSLHAFDGSVLFFAKSSAGTELWKSDGTTTAMVKDINPGAWSSLGPDPTILRVKPNLAIFAAADATHGVELWKTDGTSGGTQLFQDLVTGAGSSNPHGFRLISGYLLFLASTPGAGDEPWSLDISGL